MNPNAGLEKPTKKMILLAFIAHFERELQGLVDSARAAHLAATHEESRAEDRHDTFAIEASYLAQGQAFRVADLEQTILELRSHLESQAPSPNGIQVGSLVHVESESKKNWYYFALHGGGTQIPINGIPVTLMSPSSPMGDQMIGLQSGDGFDLEMKGTDRYFEIKGVR